MRGEWGGIQSVAQFFAHHNTGLGGVVFSAPPATPAKWVDFHSVIQFVAGANLALFAFPGLQRPALRSEEESQLTRPAESVMAFYNHRGTAERWIKEGKAAVRWTRLSCHSFAANAVRLHLHALAYNLGTFLRTLALPEGVERWSLTTLRERLIKIGAKVVSHGRYVTFQMAEVAVSRRLFAEVLWLIGRLRAPPAPA